MIGRLRGVHSVARKSIIRAIAGALHTRIAAHTHRADLTAMIMKGLWHFGYGPTAGDAVTRALPLGS